ncbi:MAG: TonB-dependent receptor [Alphaproteobacteria bacterium]|nr:MAG: TonB-dependent receptor [Alphaproteobacteria bacterium]
MGRDMIPSKLRDTRAALGVVGALLASTMSPAWAQTEDESGGGPLDEIVVTATKRGVAESAQDVPVAITAFSAEQLDRLQVQDLSDLTTAAPNVSLDTVGNAPGYANFTIRGLGINSSIPSVEPAVGMFVDGVYLGMSAGVVINMSDVESVELLRGPQGLLYGRNTTGGAVLLRTRRPGREFAVRGRADISTGPEYATSLSIEGPLAGEALRASLAGYYGKDEGWFTNGFDGASFGASETRYLRPTIIWEPSPDIDLTLILERGAVDGDGPPEQNSGAFSGFDISINFPGYVHMDWTSATLEANWRVGVGDGVITSVTGYRTLEQGNGIDGDALPTSGFHVQTALDQEQFSQELRYAGSFGPLDVTAGLYYFQQDYLYIEERNLVGGAIISAFGGDVDQTSYAAFSQLTWNVTPTVALIGGLRYSWEEKDARVATFAPSTAGSRCSLAARTCDFNFPGPGFPGVSGVESWDSTTPMLGFQWRPNDDLMVYGHWSQGVRSGGYNVRSTSLTFAPGPYDPEYQDAYELGIKSDWFDGRLRANLAVFQNRFEGMQRDINQADPLSGVVQLTRNTADATINGAELEIAWAPIDNLVINTNVGHLDGSYDRILFDLDGGGIGPSDYALRIPRLADWAYNIGATYTLPLQNGIELDWHVDYGYRDAAAFTDSNSSFLSKVNLLNAHFGATSSDGMRVSLYGRNLLDEDTEGSVTPLPALVGGGALRPLNKGRVIGVSFSFRR